MDVGPEVRRNRKMAKLADVAQKGFMEGWLEANQENFIEVMDLIKEGAPVQWARLYKEIYGMGLAKEQNINININRQQDRENLQALVRSRIPAALTERKEYTPFEEVKPEPLPLKRKKEDD